MLYIPNDFCGIGDLPFWFKMGVAMAPYMCRTQFSTHNLCIFQAQLENYGQLKPTKPLACKQDMVGKDVGVVYLWVHQEVGVVIYKMFASFFSLIYTITFLDAIC